MATPTSLAPVAVIGNGLIGHGVARVFAAAGVSVRLVGRDRASLDRALARHRREPPALRRPRPRRGACHC